MKLIMVGQQPRVAFVVVTSALLAAWLLSRRRKFKRGRLIHEVLAEAEASLPFANSSPIYNSLNRGSSHESAYLRLQYHRPDCL